MSWLLSVQSAALQYPQAPNSAPCAVRRFQRQIVPAASGGFTPVNVPGQAAPGQAAAPPPPPPPQQPPAMGSAPLPGYSQVNTGVPPSAYPAAPAGYIAAPAGPVRTGGGGAVKIILIVLAVIIGLGILGAGAVGFMVWRVAHAFHVNGKNGHITLSTPNGTVTASDSTAFTADELGTDIYPGAEATKGGMRMNLPTGSIISGAFLTPDSKDQVVAFYKSKFGSEASVFDASDSAMISLKKGDHETVMVTISSHGSENDGKTKISIVHTSHKKVS
jgi:hypothetical protein